MSALPGRFRLGASRIEDSVSVTWIGPSVLERGTAEASRCGSFWYLNRVVVQPKNARGHGIGSELVRRLQDLLKEQPDFKKLIVEAGGYTSDREVVQAFYERHGFRQEGQHMEWSADAT